MKPTTPENFDGDAATDRLDPTWNAQIDLSRLDRPDSQVYRPHQQEITALVPKTTTNPNPNPKTVSNRLQLPPCSNWSF